MADLAPLTLRGAHFSQAVLRGRSAHWSALRSQQHQPPWLAAGAALAYGEC